MKNQKKNWNCYTNICTRHWTLSSIHLKKVSRCSSGRFGITATRASKFKSSTYDSVESRPSSFISYGLIASLLLHLPFIQPSLTHPLHSGICVKLRLFTHSPATSLYFVVTFYYISN